MVATSSLSTGSALGRAVRRRIVNRHGKHSFVDQCPPNAKVLDVGCGNESPKFFKRLRPDIYYVGLDVGDYHQSPQSLQAADEYILAPPEEFDAAIGTFKGRFDGIVSSHNLERCNDPAAVLVNMAGALARGGRLYLSFPSEASVGFPSRDGCLNFYDDPTHNIVPNFNGVCETLRREGLRIQYAAPRYQPVVKRAQGLLLEPVSRTRGRVMSGTWALYGFESVIWAVKDG